MMDAPALHSASAIALGYLDDAVVAAARLRGKAAPDALHDFDRANLPLHAVGANADAALPERGHIGTDADARADSQKRVAEWLAR